MSEPLCANCNWHQLDHVPDNGSACGSYTPITSFAEWAETEPDRPFPPAELKCPECGHTWIAHKTGKCLVAVSLGKMLQASQACGCTDRPSPPAEPKCERCGFSDDERIYCSQANCPRVDRPPATTEPAESEGTRSRSPLFVQRKCDACGRLVIADLTSRLHGICEDCAYPKTTAPPAESVDDAKALEDRAKHFWREETYAEELPHKRLARFTQSEIERQTPAIIDAFVEEVEKELRVSRANSAWEIIRAIQTVKARREGGDEK